MSSRTASLAVEALYCLWMNSMMAIWTGMRMSTIHAPRRNFEAATLIATTPVVRALIPLMAALFRHPWLLISEAATSAGPSRIG